MPGRVRSARRQRVSPISPVPWNRLRRKDFRQSSGSEGTLINSNKPGEGPPMRILKLRKKNTADSSSPSGRKLRLNGVTKLPSFPDNFLVVGSSDDKGILILVVVVA